MHAGSSGTIPDAAMKKKTSQRAPYVPFAVLGGVILGAVFLARGLSDRTQPSHAALPPRAPSRIRTRTDPVERKKRPPDPGSRTQAGPQSPRRRSRSAAPDSGAAEIGSGGAPLRIRGEVPLEWAGSGPVGTSWSPRRRMLLAFRRGVSGEIRRSFLESHRLRILNTAPTLARLGYLCVEIPEEADLRSLLRDLSPEGTPLRAAGPDPYLRVMDLDPAGRAPADPWYAERCGFDRVADAFPGGVPEDVVVAVVDTGVETAIPALAARCLPGRDFLEGGPNTGDPVGHGTFCASVIAAATRGDGAFKGLCPGARILPVRVLDEDGYGTASEVAAGIVYAADRGARVILLALGGAADSPVLREAAVYARSKGCLLVAAGGNSGEGIHVYPAGFPEVFGVGGSTREDRRCAWSNVGSHIECVAPGEGILGLGAAGRSVVRNGSSASCAIAASAAAWIRALAPEWSVHRVEEAIRSTALDLGPPGPDGEFGWGRIRVDRAIAFDPPEKPEIALASLDLESQVVAGAEHLFARAVVENRGGTPDAACDLEIRWGGRTVWRETGIVVRDLAVREIDLGPVSETGASLKLLGVVRSEADTLAANNRIETSWTPRASGEGRYHVLLKNIPFVHAWVAYQAFRLLPEGALKDELEDHLWGTGVGYDDLFAPGMIWESTCSPPAGWSSSPKDGDCLLEGTYEEDTDDYGLTSLSDEDSALEHFWDPDVGYDFGLPIDEYVTGWRNHSALYRARIWWDRAIERYPTDPAGAWWCLGRVTHLLGDMGVPEHVHNDPHPSNDIGVSGADIFTDVDDISNYEEYTKIHYHRYEAAGSPIDLDALPLDIPDGYLPDGYDPDLARLFYNMAQFTQHFDSSDYDGNDAGYGGTTIDMGLAAERGTARKSYPAITYLNGRDDGVDPGTTPEVRWETLGWSGYSLFKILPEGPGMHGVSHYFDICRGEGLVCVPDGVWDDMGITDRFVVHYDFRGNSSSSTTYDFDDWSDKDDDRYHYVPDRLVGPQVDVIFPESMRYTAALYRLFWTRVHPPPPAPGNLTASDEAYADHVSVGWENVPGETGYVVYRSDEPDSGFVPIHTNSVDETTFEDPRPCGGTWYYRVEAFNTGGASDPSDADEGSTMSCVPAPVTDVSASDGAWDHEIVVTWTASPGASEYGIYRAESWFDPFEEIAAVDGGETSWHDTQPCGVAWWYKVEARNAAGSSGLSDADEGSTALCSGNVPDWLEASDGTLRDGIEILWDDVDGEDGYLLYRGMSSWGGFSLITNLPADVTRCFDPHPCGSVRFWYYVKAKYGSVYYESPTDDGRAGACIPDVPTDVSASDGLFEDFVRVAWSTAEHASLYTVHRAADPDGPYAAVGTTAGTTFDDPRPCGGGVLYYRVTASNDEGTTAPSAWDAGFTADCPPPAPEGVVATDGKSGEYVRITWNPIAGADRYTVYRADAPDGSYAALFDVAAPATSAEDRSVACGGCLSGTIYYYRVTAHVDGRESPPSDSDAGCTGPCPPETPADLTASDGEFPDRVRLSWSDVAGETYYLVQRAASPEGSYSILARLGADTVSYDDPMSCGSGPWYYRIRAGNRGGASGWSKPEEGSTRGCLPAAPQVAASDGTFSDRIRVSWKISDDTIAVRVLEARAPYEEGRDVSGWLHADETTELDRLDGEIKPGIALYYRVEAANENGSTLSEEADPGWFGYEPPSTPAPRIDPNGALAAEPVDVLLSCAAPQARIYYSTKGEEPTLDSPFVIPGTTIRLKGSCLLQARAWSPYRRPSPVTGARFGIVREGLVVAGDAVGTLAVREYDGSTVAETVLHEPVGAIRVCDVNGDGAQEIVTVPLQDDAKAPVRCFDLLLHPVWTSEVAAAVGMAGYEFFGALPEAADYDGDMEPELFVSSLTREGCSAVILEGRTGRLESRSPETTSTWFVPFFDPERDEYQAVAVTKERSSGDSLLRDWRLPDWYENWRDDSPYARMSLCAAVGRPAEGFPAVVFGGGDRGIHLLGADGGHAWTRECAAGPEVGAVFAGDLFGRGDPVLLIGGEFPEGPPAVEAVLVEDGETIWFWQDPEAAGFARILALGAVHDDRGRDVFVATGGDVDRRIRPAFQCVDGEEGLTLWKESFEPGDRLLMTGRFAATGPGGRRVFLCARNHVVEIREGATGDLVGRIEFPADVVAFDLVGDFRDADADGVEAWAEIRAGTADEDPDRYPAITSVRRISGAEVEIRWRSAPGRHYAVGVSSDLPAGFAVRKRDLEATPPENRCVLRLDPFAARAFFRVATQP